jgi:hypothetical protein
MKATVKAIRKMLFDSNDNCFLNKNMMTNKEARDYFYNLENQDQEFEVFGTENILIVNN